MINLMIEHSNLDILEGLVSLFLGEASLERETNRKVEQGFRKFMDPMKMKIRLQDICIIVDFFSSRLNLPHLTKHLILDCFILWIHEVFNNNFLLFFLF